jgi:transcriptional regulator with XRE-family HTH domain
MSENATAIVAPMRVRTAEEIRVFLARRRMSASELARRTGMTQPYMSRRLTGEIAFDVDDLDQIATVLEVNVADLLPRSARSEVTAYSTTPAAPHAVDVRSPRSRARSRFAQAAAA